MYKIDLDTLAKAWGGGITFPRLLAPLQQSSCCRARCSSQAFTGTPPLHHHQLHELTFGVSHAARAEWLVA